MLTSNKQSSEQFSYYVTTTRNLQALIICRQKHTVIILGVPIFRTFTMVQIRRGQGDNLGISFPLLHKNIQLDPSLELSGRDGFNKGQQNGSTEGS